MSEQKDGRNVRAVKTFLEAQHQDGFDAAFADYATPEFNGVVSTRNNAELTGVILWAGP